MTPDATTRLVLICPPNGLQRWQQHCLERLEQISGIQIVGIYSCPEAKATRSSLPAWLDHLTRPSLAAKRRPARTSTAIQPAQLSWQELITRLDEQAPAIILTMETSLEINGLPAKLQTRLWQFQTTTPAGTLADAGIGELLAGQTRLCLYISRPSGKDLSPSILARGCVPAVLHSRKRSLARLFEIAPDLLAQALRRYASGELPTTQTLPNPIGDGKITALRFGKALCRANLRRWPDKLIWRQQWDIGLLDQRIPLPSPQQIAQARWLASPRHGFWADPFFLADSSQDHVLVEEYINDKQRGIITALDTATNPVASRPLLSLDTHLSFPRSYEHAGRTWLVPEMASAGQQWAYRLDDQGQLEPDSATLISGLHGIDPVIFQHDGLFWALISPSGRRANYQLELYMATDFFGPYKPHPANPVLIDPHGGRCAGPVIHQDGQLLRFGQVQGRYYGQAIDVFAITWLTPTTYQEKYLGRIQPEQSTGAGMHTIDFHAQATVIDRFRIVPFWRR